MIEQLFFELIRVAIGTQGMLSRLPSVGEWGELYKMAKKQSLVGICFAGLQRLGADADEGFERIGMSERLYLTWMGMAVKIQQRNEIVNQQCVALQKRLSADGLRSCILKGQGVGALYRVHGNENSCPDDTINHKPSTINLVGLRQSGDIDVYVECGRKKAIEYARSIQDEVDWDYKHLHLKVFEDTEVEMHYVPEVFLNLRKNKRLQVWFMEHQEEMFNTNVKFNDSVNSFITTPSIEFNLFYILLHTYRHFLYEGVGLRQLMDYYFVLSNPVVVDSMRHNTITTVNEFGMTRFTKGVMWIMKDVFGMDEQHLLCEPDEKEGRYILNEVMTGGNFGHHDERLKDEKTTGKKRAVKKILKHNLHLLSHYPADTLWAPIWIVYHWCWKRMNRI